jgi:glycosyltransferase involved in cell wall biosynthesis
MSRDRALPEIVLVSANEIGSGALEAHLGELGRRLSAHGRVHWGAVESPRLFVTRPGRRERAAFLQRAGAGLSGRVVMKACGPRLLGLRDAGRRLGRALRRQGVAADAILHARGYLGALVALAAREEMPQARVIHDVRGDRPAEVRLHGGESSPERVADMERRVAASADAHLCVSRPLQALLRQRYGVAAEVFPCVADTQSFRPDMEARRRVRAALGLGEAFVLGFVGSCAPWQRPDAVAALFASLLRLRPGARLLVLSPDRDAWDAELRRGGAEAAARAVILRAPHSEVPAHLAACDATALMRSDDDVNRPASPIKFGESLACGVPVLLTDHIGDSSAAVRDEGLGACFDDALLRGPQDVARLRGLLDRIERDREAVAAACRRFAEREWSWDVQVPQRLAHYRSLATSERPRRAAAGAAP